MTLGTLAIIWTPLPLKSAVQTEVILELNPDQVVSSSVAWMKAS